jgi:hypothetical protein
VSDELVHLLQDLYREKLAQYNRHQAAAKLVAQYDANNAYQYIVNRDEVHLSWLSAAIRDLGGAVDDGAGIEDRGVTGRGAAAAKSVMEEDARDAQAFVDRWRARVDAMINARHRGMVRVMLGELLEQRRTFEQAIAGRTDLLGRHPEHATPSSGEVLPTRWLE